jgi:sugar lactone lactonase YvrE
MSQPFRRIFSGLCLFLAATTVAWAANLIIYDDQSENGFNDGCSFPGQPNPDFNFADTTTVHGGTHSVRFTPDNFNAVSWCAPATYSATTDYTGIDFWVNGGATGSQNVNLVLGLAGNPVSQASLTALQGIPLAANLWVHFQLTFADPGGLNYGGQFDQISFQDESGAIQADMYLDDVTLISAAAAGSGQNYIFGDSFEPEYLLVPQYTNSSLKVYQRTTNTTSFSTLVNTASLPVNTAPNAVSFAPDGNLWVVDDGNHKLQRFTLASVLANATPAPTATVNVSAGLGGLYDLAFFGSNAYVSSDSGVLKYSLATLNAGGSPAPTILNSGGTPVGLAFDAQGHLWICNYGTPGNLVRMTTTGTIEVSISGNSIQNAEGLAFDEFGSLWVADNIQPEMYGYSGSQITANGSPTPIGQINTYDAGPNGSSGFAGGIAVDRRGDMRVNYEYDQTVRAYTATAAPWSGPYTSYTSSELTALPNATTDPGRGGIAIWPVPSTVHR